MPTRLALWQLARIVVLAGSCAAAIYVVSGTVWTASQTHTRIIFWDMWGWILTLREWLESGFTWSSLFALDNEHRMVVGRLLFFLDYLIDRQNSRTLVALTLAQYFVTAGILMALFRRAAGPVRADWIANATFSAFAAVMLFAGSNLEILQFGFQVAYAWALLAMPVAAFLVVLSVETSARGSKDRAAVWIALATCVCATATYSSPGGILIWPLVFFLAFFVGAPRRHLALIVIFAVTCIGGYFFGYRSSTYASNPLTTLFRAETYTLFLPLLFGNPFAPAFEVAKAQALSPHAWFVLFGWLGMFGAAGVMLAWSASQYERRPWRPAQLALFAIVIYALVAGLSVALLRQNWGWTVAIVDRYRTATSLFWIANCMLLFSLAQKLRYRDKALQLAIGALMVTMIGMVTYHQRDALKVYSDRHQRWQVAADAFRVGVMDWQAFESVDLAPRSRLLPLIQFIRDRRLSVFSDGRFELVGQRFTEKFLTTPDAVCKGEVEDTIAIPDDLGGWRLSGSAWNNTKRRAPALLVLVDSATNRIVGLGTGGLSLVSRPSGGSRAFTGRDGWAGYARARPGDFVVVYGVDADGAGSCRFAAAQLRSS